MFGQKHRLEANPLAAVAEQDHGPGVTAVWNGIADSIAMQQPVVVDVHFWVAAGGRKPGLHSQLFSRSGSVHEELFRPDLPGAGLAGGGPWVGRFRNVLATRESEQ